MFRRFLKEHSFGEYDFAYRMFPDINNREYWDNYSSREIIEKAEKYLDYSWPPIKATAFMEFKRSGDRLCMEDVHFERREALAMLVMGEHSENRGRFLPDIVNGIFSICEESYWGLSAHWYKKIGNIPTPHEPYIDLYASETAEHLAVAIDVLRAPLLDFCPEIIDRVERELEIRIKEPYLTHKDFDWMGYEVRPANWTTWILSNVITVFLLTEKNTERLGVGLTKMFVEMQHYYDVIPADGGCDEGVHYWDRAGAAIFEFVYQVKLASGGAVDLFDDEKFKNMGLYTKNAHIYGARFICFADCSETKKTGIVPFIYGYGRETKTPALISLAREVFRDGGAKRYQPSLTLRRNIICHDFISELSSRDDIAPFVGERCACMNDLEVATLRAGDWILAAKGGHNAESHNHNDVGTFSLYFKDEPILCDVGTAVYSKKTFSLQRYEIPWVRSITHNLPEINGEEEKNGRKYQASSFEAEEGRVKISFADAYPSSAAVSSVDRVCNLGENGLLLTDKFEFSGEEKKVKEGFVTTLPVRVLGDTAIIDERFFVTASGANAQTEYFSFEGDRNLVGSWKCEGVTRIFFEFDGAESITVTAGKLA